MLEAAVLPGAVLVSLMIVAYSVAGGIRASIWTDAAQSCVMLAAMALLCGVATATGMLSRLYLPELAELDPELALPTLALALLPDFFVGMILAGIFAATMSTADSLVLSCSAAVSHDLLPRRLEKPRQLKIVTAAVTTFALLVALSGNRSVFHLVILSWSTLASAFAPLLTVYCLGRRLTEPAAIVVMLLGVTVAIGWRALGWQDMVYEGLPGILAGLIAAALLSTGRIPAISVETRYAND